MRVDVQALADAKVQSHFARLPRRHCDLLGIEKLDLGRLYDGPARRLCVDKEGCHGEGGRS